MEILRFPFQSTHLVIRVLFVAKSCIFMAFMADKVCGIYEIFTLMKGYLGLPMAHALSRKMLEQIVEVLIMLDLVFFVQIQFGKIPPLVRLLVVPGLV